MNIEILLIVEGWILNIKLFYLVHARFYDLFYIFKELMNK